MLGEKETSRWLEDQTRLSRFLGPDPLYKCLDVLYHYPAFLFHDSPQQQALRAEFGSDYEHSLDLLLRSGFGARNLGARLRAFRMQHDLTLVETASLLDLSKSELHRLERSERRPSPRTRYRIMRLLTLPPLEGYGFSHTEKVIVLSRRGKRAASLRGQHAGRAGKKIRAHQCLPRAEPRGSSVVPTLKSLLSLPPPRSDAPSSAETLSGVEGLRQAWLAGRLSARQLAPQLGISQPHLLRLLRGDRKPSRALLARLESLLP